MRRSSKRTSRPSRVPCKRRSSAPRCTDADAQPSYIPSHHAFRPTSDPQHGRSVQGQPSTRGGHKRGLGPRAAHLTTQRRAGLGRGYDRPAMYGTDAGFGAAYLDLEARMKALAEGDGDVFWPNPEPLGRVDYIFVCMEPSLGASSPDKVRAFIDAGGRCFVNSIEDFILHFCIRQYLCRPGQHYHITDLSKGGMPVERARVARPQRYDRWHELLVEEVNLVAAPGAHVFAVGQEVARHLARRGFTRPFTTVIHYSPLAGSARSAGIVGHEETFECFMGSVTLQQVLVTADEVLNASVPASIRDETMVRLARRQLSDSRQRLIFNYKLAFESATADA